MFLWLQVQSPRFQGVQSEELFKMLAAGGLIVVPGQDFAVPRITESAPTPRSSLSASPDTSQDLPAVRLTFAAASAANIREGVQRLAKVIVGL